MDLNNLQVGDATVVGGTKITAKKKFRKGRKKKRKKSTLNPDTIFVDIKKITSELEALALATTDYSKVKTLKEMIALEKRERQRFKQIRKLMDRLYENKLHLENYNETL